MNQAAIDTTKNTKEKAAVKEHKRPPALRPARFGAAAHMRNLWVVNAEAGTDIESLNDPSYWAHIAGQVRPYDKIEARIDDGSFYAEYLVLAVGNNEVTVEKLFQKKLTTKISGKNTIINGLIVKWNGPQEKYVLIREKDSMTVETGLYPYEKAVTAALNRPTA